MKLANNIKWWLLGRLEPQYESLRTYALRAEDTCMYLLNENTRLHRQLTRLGVDLPETGQEEKYQQQEQTMTDGLVPVRYDPYWDTEEFHKAQADERERLEQQQARAWEAENT